MSNIKSIKKAARKELVKFYETLAILRPDIPVSNSGPNPDEFTILYIRQLQQAQAAIYRELTKLEQDNSGLTNYVMDVTIAEPKPRKKL